MNSMKQILTIALLVILLTPGLWAGTVTLDDFLGQLQERHPIFEKENLTVEIERENQKSYLGTRDWNLNSSLFYSHEEPSFATAGPEKTDVFVIDAGLDKVFWNTGGRLSAGYIGTYAALTIDPIWGAPDSYFENELAVTYVHPLLKNKGGFLDRLEYNLKKFDIDLSEIVAIENQEEFLGQQAAKYLQWVFLLEQKKIIEQRLELSEELLENMRQKRKANLIDEVDIIRSENEVRIADQNLLLIESKLDALKAELAVLTQIPDYNNGEPDYAMYEPSELPALAAAKEQLRQKSRLLQSLRINIEKLKYAKEGYRGISKPELSAIAQVSLKNAEESYGRSLVLDKPNALIGLQLNYPIGFSSSKAKISQTDYQIRQLEKQYEQISLELVSALVNLYTQLVGIKSVLELNKEQIDASRRKTEEEIRLYNQGRGDLTFVIQSRDSEQSARLTYAENGLTYHLLLLQYRSLMDQLISQ